MSDVMEDFVLPVDKPTGPTSHDVVAWARRGLGTRRIGHTGTLDPFASGLLLLCVGRSTRLAEYLSGLDKSYEAVARMGARTDTLDREGEITDESEAWRSLEESALRTALETLQGPQEQVPPEYSAKKIGGEAAYRRARRGESVALQPVSVEVHEIELTSIALPLIGFRVRCSSGTYIRALARDLGDALEVGAHLVELRRSRIGAFELDGAVPASLLGEPGRVSAAAIGPLDAVSHMPRVDLGHEAAGRLVMGQPVPVDTDDVDGPVAVSHRGGLLAIGESSQGMLRPRKVFAA